jgi:hypothetical protein
MGLIRTVEWSLIAELDDAKRQLRRALSAAEMDPQCRGTNITATSHRSLKKNRSAAKIWVDLSPLDEGTCATIRVELMGNGHSVVLDEIAEALGDDAFADQGIVEAVEKLGEDRTSLRQSAFRRLRDTLRADETVLALGRGTRGDDQGLVILTDQRLIFSHESLTDSEAAEDFDLPSIESLDVRDEELVTNTASGNGTAVRMPGAQAQEIERAFRELKSESGERASTA